MWTGSMGSCAAAHGVWWLGGCVFVGDILRTAPKLGYRIQVEHVCRLDFPVWDTGLMPCRILAEDGGVPKYYPLISGTTNIFRLHPCPGCLNHTSPFSHLVNGSMLDADLPCARRLEPQLLGRADKQASLSNTWITSWVRQLGKRMLFDPGLPGSTLLSISHMS